MILPRSSYFPTPYVWTPRLFHMPGYPCCCRKPPLECDGCIDGKAPRKFQVVIAGVTDNDCDQLVLCQHLILG